MALRIHATSPEPGWAATINEELFTLARYEAAVEKFQIDRAFLPVRNGSLIQRVINLELPAIVEAWNNPGTTVKYILPDEGFVVGGEYSVTVRDDGEAEAK